MRPLLHSSSRLQHRCSVKDLRTCIALLQASANEKNLIRGKQVHSYMLTNGFLNSPPSITSVINMYSKCQRMNDAVSVFNHPSDEDRNVFAFNAVIAGFIANERSRDGLEFYRRMREVGVVVPDKYTFPCVIRACCDLMEVRKIHGLLFKLGLELDIFVGSALVNTYLKFGLMEDAQEVFVGMPEKDVVSWNAMVNGYAQIGCFDEALEIFRIMSKEGVVPSNYTVTGVLSIFAVTGDIYNGRAVHGFVVKMGYDSGVTVLNALIDVYGKCKCTKDALDIFEMMDEKDIFSWNSIISVHEQCGDHDGTLRLFDQMLRVGVLPDLVTITTVLPACSNLAALMHGREIHGYMIRKSLGNNGDQHNGIDDVLINNALMDMYAKCGSMRIALKIFDKMSNKDTASWNIMIMGYGMHGNGNEALNMFARMCEANFKPDEVTLVGVLSACNHAGLLTQGREFFTRMTTKYSVAPTIEHYTCVVDMLGRAGKLKEAYEIVVTMPIEANPVVWRALLAACRLHGDADLARIAAQRVIELEPGHCGSYVLISNIYGVDGQYEEVSEVRQTMRQQNVKKTPGCSWIELKDGVHTFVTGDRGHPGAHLIYAELNSLTARLCDHGYVPHI
ncbi:pentatricopeptide repeat-containing protein At3g14730 [Humulus lupulus]|uniref:pentatricopeptide repeat-containing protein At3g14730 n=1 Tax=Humulus lupulus TaxID=3486 RepID=UPI002B415305|nr:pentatricopeptide repeat-containing protein At3g14730 [Humulus lupulus]